MPNPPYKAPKSRAYDIVIVGGAVVGSSTAYWLSQKLGRDASVLVVERDSSYEFSSTALSTSAIRQQYSNPINVKISQFGIEFIRDFAERCNRELGKLGLTLATDDEIAEGMILACCSRPLGPVEIEA